MGGAIFTIFFIIIVLNILSSAGGKHLNKKVKTYRPQNSNTGGSNSPWGAAENGSPAQSSGQNRNASFKQGMQQAAVRETRRRIEQQMEDRRADRATRSKDVADKNRNRIADWGEREGPGLLTVPNVLIATAAIIVLLYIFR